MFQNKLFLYFQDENWGENTTAVTGNTSEQSGSLEDLALWPGGNQETGLLFLCHRYIGSVFTAVLSVISFLSPLLMLALPKLGEWATSPPPPPIKLGIIFKA